MKIRKNNIVYMLLGSIVGAGLFFILTYTPQIKTIKNTVVSTNNDTTTIDESLEQEKIYFESSLDSLHQIMANPLAGEWLDVYDEPGQTLKQYQKIQPITKADTRYKLYIQPLGSFSPTEKAIVIITADYLSKFYNLPVEILDSLSTNLIPDSLHRIRTDYHQLNAKYILYNVLKPRLPEDAVAYIAFSNLDLYPKPERNFVFGLGSLKNRVGVYSLARFGNPDESQESYKTCLLRTLKVASHELGHMFSIKHCIEYDCLMNGSNDLIESDSNPFHLCPIDLVKICWNMEIDEIDRFQQLANFWKQNGFPENAQFCIKSIELLKRNEFRRR